MGIMNVNYWSKSYMLEFLKGDKIENVFTFSVPPESEELVFSHRLSETKTFGGSVFDSYGNDTIRINLSGNTINNELKFIYCGLSKAPKFLSGEKEVFELQKIITDWNNVEENNIEKKIYLYDLSKMNAIQLATGQASRNYWRIFIRDFKIKRDKSKPNTYSYSLECLGVVDDKQCKKGFFENTTVNELADKISNTMEKLGEASIFVESGVMIAEQIFSQCSKVKNFWQNIGKNKNADKILTSKFDSVVRVLTGTSNNFFYNSISELLSILNQCKAFTNGDKKLNKKSATQDNSKFIVSFVSNGGSIVKSQEVEYCQVAKMPENPTREDYSFIGWFADEQLTEVYDFNQEVTSRLFLYAGWELAVATVSFNSKNGSSVASQKIKIGEVANIPTPPIRNGYKFVCWNVDYSATVEFDFSTLITDNLTLYARYVPICVVSFDSDGGTEIENQVLAMNDLVVYPLTPKKGNYTFAYWCSDENKTQVFDFSTPIIHDTILYAVYVQISNTVFFDSKQGSFVEEQKVPIGGYAVKPENPIRDGYDFIYWCTDIDLTNEFNFLTTPINANITLYAKWQRETHSVVFDSDGGSEITTQNITHGLMAVFPCIPEKGNCVFEMWQIETEDVIDENENMSMATVEYREFDFSTPITKDIVLRAKWFGE